MPALADYQERVKTVCLGPEPATEAVASLGDEAWRWHRYRTMVRRRLLGVVEHALPRFVAAVGVEQVALLFDRFL